MAKFSVSINFVARVLTSLILFLALPSFAANAGDFYKLGYFRVDGESEVSRLDHLLSVDNWSQIFVGFNPLQPGWEWTPLKPEEYRAEGVSIGFHLKKTEDPKKKDSDGSGATGILGWASRFVSTVKQSFMDGNLIGDVSMTPIDCEGPFLKIGQRFDINFGRSDRKIQLFLQKISVHICSEDGLRDDGVLFRRIRLSTSLEPGSYFPGSENPIVTEFVEAQLDTWGRALHAVRMPD